MSPGLAVNPARGQSAVRARCLSLFPLPPSCLLVLSSFVVYPTLPRHQNVGVALAACLSARRSALRRGGPFPSRVTTPNRSSPLSDPPCTFSTAHSVSGELTFEDEPVTVCNLVPTGPAWRSRLCLFRVRATPASPDVLLRSLGCAPRQIHRSKWGGEPPVEAELRCGDPGVYGSPSLSVVSGGPPRPWICRRRGC